MDVMTVAIWQCVLSAHIQRESAGSHSRVTRVAGVVAIHTILAMVGNYELVAYTPTNTKNYEFAGRSNCAPTLDVC